MLYALPSSSRSLRTFIARDSPRADCGLGDDLRELIMERLEKIDPYMESKEYCRQRERAGRLQDSLNAMLSEEGRAMLREYSEALESAHSLETEILAERAFLEGLRMMIRATMK